MSHLVVQPASGTTAREHYEDTIAQLVPLDSLKPYLKDEEFSALYNTYLAGAAPIWGVTPGTNGVNFRKWQRIAPGDIVLFAMGGRFIRSGTVTFLFHNPELARHLWGEDDDGDTWEYVYFLDDLAGLDIPYVAFNSAVGYKINAVPQGFNVLGEELASLYANALEPDRVGREALARAVVRFDANAPLERMSNAIIRQEQATLRNHLLQGHSTGICGICGYKLPANLLVAGHIKPRTSCTDEEKRDIQSIAMLYCVLGCDALYEKGYIYVKEGVVRSRSKANDMDGLKGILNGFDGNPCPYWTPERAVYFRWHAENVDRI